MLSKQKTCLLFKKTPGVSSKIQYTSSQRKVSKCPILEYILHFLSQCNKTRNM